jgi:hypothetical protein
LCYQFNHNKNFQQWKQQLKNALVQMLPVKRLFVTVVITAPVSAAPAAALAALNKPTGRRHFSPGFKNNQLRKTIKRLCRFTR